MRLSQICIAIAQLGRGGAWSPLALWPDGVDSPGMWISPRDLTSEWQDYTGTTPVVEPGTVADSANPVGLALDIRAGATALSDPGNHMLQSTSAARPLESARVNLLTYTDTISGAGWAKRGTASVTVATAPDGTGETATGIGAVTAGDFYQVSVSTASGIRVAPSISLWPISTTGIVAISNANDSANGLWSVDLALLTTGQWNDITRTHPAVTIPTEFTSTSDPYGILVECTSGAPVSFYVKNPQLNFGTVSLAYQSVPGNGSTYTATGFPIYQKYDGVDDGMATASFAAGTLINGMDCMIAVRRDSGAATYLISDTGSRGFFEWESGDTNRPDVSAGTPTYYVDGVACTATRGALFTALTAGEWHILEARGLDLSTWTKVEVSSLVSYRLNGPRGDIMLYPSTASTEDKDAARQWLADYYGVTL